MVAEGPVAVRFYNRPPRASRPYVAPARGFFLPERRGCVRRRCRTRKHGAAGARRYSYAASPLHSAPVHRYSCAILAHEPMQRWSGVSIHRFRYGGRFGSWLALIALAFQLAVSFGHVHLDGVRIVSKAAAVGQPSHTAQSLPAQQPGDKDDYCAICASLYLAANSFVPLPPPLPVPLLPSSEILHIDYGAALSVAPRRLAFQSRAPPLA
jgi:hypothetical protein